MNAQSPKESPEQRQARYDAIRRKIVKNPEALKWDGFSDFKNNGVILSFALKESGGIPRQDAKPS